MCKLTGSLTNWIDDHCRINAGKLCAQNRSDSDPRAQQGMDESQQLWMFIRLHAVSDGGLFFERCHSIPVGS